MRKLLRRDLASSRHKTGLPWSENRIKARQTNADSRSSLFDLAASRMAMNRT